MRGKMNSSDFEKRIEELKKEKYKLLVTKYNLTVEESKSWRQDQLIEAVEKSISFVEAAILSTKRIIDYYKQIEDEYKSYQIIEKQLETVILDYQLDQAPDKLTVRKMKRVKEDIEDLSDILKYKK